MCVVFFFFSFFFTVKSPLLKKKKQTSSHPPLPSCPTVKFSSSLFLSIFLLMSLILSPFFFNCLVPFLIPLSVCLLLFFYCLFCPSARCSHPLLGSTSAYQAPFENLADSVCRRIEQTRALILTDSP